MKIKCVLAGFVLMIIASCIFLDYWNYSRAFYVGELDIGPILQGKADAPFQYRILIPYLVSFLSSVSHLGIRHVLALIDLVSLAITCWLIFSAIFRLESYRRNDCVFNVVILIVAIALLEYYLLWLPWYQKADTLLSALYVALTVFVLTQDIQIFRRYPYVAPSIAIIASAIESFSRPDVVALLNGGLCMSALLFRNILPKINLAAVIGSGAFSAGIALSVQYYLAYVVYPHATYGSTPVFQLLFNLNIIDLGTFILFSAPWIYTIAAVLRNKHQKSVAGILLVVPSLAYIVIVLLIGRIIEVRLFYPFVLAYLPTTADTILHGMLRLKPHSAQTSET